MSELVSKDGKMKLRYDLIPAESLKQLAEVYTISTTKYPERSWEKGLAWSRFFAAMMRHMWAWWSGEKIDRDNGQHHLAAVAWGALALMELERTHPEHDDRVKPAELVVTAECHSIPVAEH